MASRMDRYSNNYNKASRTRRNKNLYSNIYSYGRYSNIEGIASMEKNEVDISKVKEMIESKENFTNERQYRNYDIDKVEELPTVRKRYTENTEKNYDIMDVLKSAREKKEPDNKERVFNNTNYDVLKKLNLKPNFNPEKVEKEDIKEMIENISNTSMLNKIDDKDLASDMFKDLVSDDTMVGNVKDFKEFKNVDDKNEKTMDDSFFTKGVKLRKADFVGGEEKKSTFKTVLLVLLVLGLIAGVVVLILYYFKIL